MTNYFLSYSDSGEINGMIVLFKFFFRIPSIKEQTDQFYVVYEKENLASHGQG